MWGDVKFSLLDKDNSGHFSDNSPPEGIYSSMVKISMPRYHSGDRWDIQFDCLKSFSTKVNTQGVLTNR